MLDFSPITDERLRRLAMASTAIASLPEAQAVGLIARMGAATAEQQSRLAGVLADEQAGLDAFQAQQLQMINEQIEQMNQLLSEFKKLGREYDVNMLKLAESKTQEEEGKIQQQLLDQLSSV